MSLLIIDLVLYNSLIIKKNTLDFILSIFFFVIFYSSSTIPIAIFMVYGSDFFGSISSISSYIWFLYK